MGLLEDALRAYALFEDRTTDPSTPAANRGLIYFKDGVIHSIDDAGTVRSYGSAGYEWIDDNEQPQEYPGSPGSVDDEFDDGSLDVAWSVTNNPAGGDAVSESRHAGFIHVGLAELGTDNFDNAVRVHQTPPAGAATATYIARVSLAVVADAQQTDDGEFTGVWVYLGNSVNDEAVGAGISVNVGALATPMATNILNCTAGSIGGAGTAMPVLPGSFVYVKLEKAGSAAYTSANTYNAYVSGDGVIWHHFGSQSFTFTTACDEFGVFFRRPKSQTGTPKSEALVDFVRKVA